jgi:decaprenylphospho-beta-D-erythro-pentofuranosid-2-ulose 2-reductase
LIRPPRRIAIFGAETRVAYAASRIWAAQGTSVVIVGHGTEAMRILEDDLRLRAPATTGVHAEVVDLTDPRELPELWKRLRLRFPDLDAVLIAQGKTTDLAQCESSSEALMESFRCNALSPLSLLGAIANDYAEQRFGCIGVLGSIFGDRGIYGYHIEGAASASVAVFLAGLRQRLGPLGVRVLTLKLGLIATPGKPANVERRFLRAQPERLARGIVDAFARRDGEIYLPAVGRWMPWLGGRWFGTPGS